MNASMTSHADVGYPGRELPEHHVFERSLQEEDAHGRSLLAQKVSLYYRYVHLGLLK
jgi:hypothetical protein